MLAELAAVRAVRAVRFGRCVYRPESVVTQVMAVLVELRAVLGGTQGIVGNAAMLVTV